MTKTSWAIYGCVAVLAAVLFVLVGITIAIQFRPQSIVVADSTTRPVAVDVGSPSNTAPGTSTPARINAPTSTFTPNPLLPQQIDAAWGAGDWPKVIVLLKQQSPVDADKLYAAYYNDGQRLLAQGNKTEAAKQFQNALNVQANGTEAQQALHALTPTVIPPTPGFKLVTRRLGPIHDSLRDQDYSMEITINDLRWYTGGNYDHPKSGYIYVIVSAVVRNLGPGTVYSVYSTNFQVKDANGAIHGETYVSSVTRDCAMDLVDLSAGGTNTGCISFEVPTTGRLDFIFAPYKYEGLVSGRYLSFQIR